MEDVIADYAAKMGFKMAIRLNEVVKKIAKHLKNIFSAISATVALTPIPIADIYILLLIQSLLVALIASLSGRDISLETAKEFILGLGGVVGAGYSFRLLAQQATKLFNFVFPGSGSVVSSGIASYGTSTIGKAAISHYIDNKTIEMVKKKYKEDNKKAEDL